MNDGASEWITSTVGIPQEKVLSPLLCNLYTNDSMDEGTCYHTEFADDNVVLNINENLQELAREVVAEGDKVAKYWCDKWKTGIEALITKTLIVSPLNMDVPDVKIKLKGQDLEVVKEKKLLGIITDIDMKFDSHVTTRKRQALKALNA